TQAETAQGGVQYGAATVAAPGALNPHRQLPPGLDKIPGITTADQAVVARQLGQAVGSAVAFKVGGRGAQVHAPGCEAGGDQAGVLQATQADGQIELAVKQILRLVGQGDLDAQLRILLHELVDQR